MRVLSTHSKMQCHGQVRAKGTAWAMAVELGCGEMRFGECGAGGTCDMVTNIRNKDRQLPVTFSVARVAHFKIRPSAGRLLPLQVCYSQDWHTELLVAVLDIILVRIWDFFVNQDLIWNLITRVVLFLSLFSPWSSSYHSLRTLLAIKGTRNMKERYGGIKKGGTFKGAKELPLICDSFQFQWPDIFLKFLIEKDLTCELFPSAVFCFSCNNGAHLVYLPVYGSCNAIPASRTAHARGPSAQTSDFLPSFNFKESDAHSVALQKAKRLTMRGPEPDLPAWVRNPPIQVTFVASLCLAKDAPFN